MPKQRQALLIIIPFLALGVMGCAEMPDAAQTLGGKAVGEIYGTRSVGQTFIASHDGLSRIDVQLATYRRRNTQPIIFHLRSAPYASKDIATITFEAEDVKDNAYHAFRFPPIPDSQGHSFYFSLESPTSRPGDAITMYYSPGDVYAEGQMYIQGEPQDGDLAFRAYYTYGPGEILQDAYFGIKSHIVPVLLMILLCLLPGYALLQSVGPDLSPHFDPPQRLILALGLSLALIPLLLLLCTLLGLKLGKAQATGILAGFGAISLVHISKGRRWGSLLKAGGVDPVYPLLLLTVLLSLLVRFLPVLGFPVPPGSDSYHHALITRLIIEKGGIPDSYEPYAPLSSFTYHFGFHSLVALFHWLSGVDAARSVLIMGQLLNGLIPLSIFFFAVRLTKSKIVGLFSALITGLLSVFPAYYVNWGRFTQGAGLVLLPIVLALTIECLEREKRDVRALIMTSIILSGLCLTHYRILIFYLAFMAVYLIITAWFMLRHRWSILPRTLSISIRALDSSDAHRQERSHISESLGRLLVIGALSALLVSPWIWRLSHSPTLGKLTRAPIRSETILFSLDRLGNACCFYSNLPLLALYGLGALWGLWKREHLSLLLLLWVGFLLILSNPWFKLPGARLTDFITIITSLFFPASITIGSLGGRLLETLEKGFPQARLLVGLLIVALALGSVGKMIAIVEPESVYVQEADKSAMAWIRENTPSEAKFLIPSLIYDRAVSLVMGRGAGYWIPFFTGRRTTVPPLTYLGERPVQKDYIARVVALADASHKPTTKESLRLFRESDVSYFYIGKRCAALDFGDLIDDPHYQLVYDRYGVRIFELHYQGLRGSP